MATVRPDTILLPENINFGLYQRLVALLSENNLWIRVAECFEVFSEYDIQKLMTNQLPAEKFLSELGSRLCTVEIFCSVLEKCQLYDVLVLFKKHSPVQIIEQTAENENNNFHMVTCGGKFMLYVKAIGMPPPTYQWYHENIELTGENDSSLVLNNFELENEGEYYCVINQKGFGSLVSKSVCLIMAPICPVIVKQPNRLEVCSTGSIITVAVKARGHPALNYQWYKENQQLVGCTSPTLTLNIEKPSQEGKYRCYVYNSAGEVWSSETTINVYAAPNPEPSAKLALLISNQSYSNLNRLYTPENDVKTMANLLQDLGFLVVALQNLNLVEMRNSILKFSKLIPEDAYVVFYFAGHGFEIQDKFMLPVDAPGPEDYLQSDAICERELLKAILSSKPKLFLELLDMCLKPPDPSNQKILQATTDLFEYEANNNLIQGYSTTSYLGAYEKRTGKNGLYVEHLKRYLTKDKDLPIVEILQRVARDVASVCMKQKPFFGTNITMDFRLTDHCNHDPSVRQKFDELSLLPSDFVLKFNNVSVESEVSFSKYLDVFLNTLEVRFTNLTNFRVSCEAVGKELSFELFRSGDVLHIKVMNIQRLLTSKTLTLMLMKNENLVDCAIWDIGKPMIAAIDLWWNPEGKSNMESDSDQN